MEAIIQGTVVRSIKKEGKKYFATSIFQNDQEVIPQKIGTIKSYNPGEKINIKCRLHVSEFKGKLYLTATETENQGNGTGQPVAGNKAT